MITGIAAYRNLRYSGDLAVDILSLRWAPAVRGENVADAQQYLGTRIGRQNSVPFANAWRRSPLPLNRVGIVAGVVG